MRWRIANSRKRCKLYGPKFPPRDLLALQIVNRFAASRAVYGVRYRLQVRMAGLEVGGVYYLRSVIYDLKDRILATYGRAEGLALQYWTSAVRDWSDDYSLPDGAHHYHILERIRLGGRTFHRPTGHFYYVSDVDDYYKKTVGFEEIRKQCVEKIEGRKKVTRHVPSQAEAIRALNLLLGRYGGLPRREPEKVRIISGNYMHDLCQERERKRLQERGERSIQCWWCLKVKPGFDVVTMEGKEICTECKAKIHTNPNPEPEYMFESGALVPSDVATCPDCGGQLQVDPYEWDSETKMPTETGFHVHCFGHDGNLRTNCNWDYDELLGVRRDCYEWMEREAEDRAKWREIVASEAIPF